MAVAKPSFQVRSIAVKDLALAPGKELDYARAFALGGSQRSMAERTAAMKASFPVGASASQISADMVAASVTPGATLCHGSCCEVPLKGPSTFPAAIKAEDVRLFPSVRRAMAEIAAMNVGSADQVDAVEMMLDDLESMKSSLGGVLDMPGMAHAATFQNVPGKSSWHARIEIKPKQAPYEVSAQFDVDMVAMSSGLQATGYWPKMTMRSASNQQDWMSVQFPPDLMSEPAPAQPQQPTTQELDPWWDDVQDKFEATAAAALADGKEIDAHLVQVVDRRKDAQSTTLGKTAGKGGSDGAGWWIDVKDRQAVDELYRSATGAKVVLPNKDNLFEVPGPRWNRPWSPQVVLFGTGRSVKFGMDGRFRVDGYLKTRMSGETMTAIAVGSNARVYGKDIMEKPNDLFSKAGIPSEARALVQEALLLDTESAGIMARLASGRTATKDALANTQKQMRSAVRGLWLSRDQRIVADKKPNLSAVATYGKFPSDVAISPWQDPRDPLFIDINYTHPHSSMAQDWKLDQDCVETRAKGPEATNPPATSPPGGNVEVIEERTRVTASVVNVLKSALVTKEMADVSGHLVKAQKAPAGLSEDTFDKMDVVSAPLTALDSTLVSRDYRERTGALRVNKVQLVDMFGLAREWNSGLDPQSAEGSSTLSYWTELHPRLPYWARLHFRLQQADNSGEEADPLAHPICGILVPDFVEHALEIFDGNGKAIGQLTTDRPRFGGGPGTPGASLQTTFMLHPWVAVEKGIPPNADPLDGIDNPTLKALLASLLAQGASMPAEASGIDWFETGMSAMLRSIDTVRATLDPSQKTPDKRIKLLGEPILVLAARLSYEGTASTNPSQLAQDPPLFTEPPAMPPMTVRIGDATRPDDGVLGCFNAGATPESGRFAPVTKEAAEKAILNGLAMGVPFFSHQGLAVKHPFVLDQESAFQLKANQPTDIVILADPRGGLYATCGVLPRKKIMMPKEFIQASLKDLEPTFRVGPIFTSRTIAALKALVPPPEIEGLDAEYVYRQPGEDGSPATFPEAKVPPVPPIGELPKDRAVLSDGWIRVFKPPET